MITTPELQFTEASCTVNGCPRPNDITADTQNLTSTEHPSVDATDPRLDLLFDCSVVILSVEYTLGAIMNGLVLIAIVRSRRLLKIPFYVLVTGLCCSECLGGLATPLRLVTNFAEDVPFELLCTIYESLFLLLVLLNNFSLLTISSERICALKLPMFCKRITVGHVVGFQVASWLLCVAAVVFIMMLGEAFLTLTFQAIFQP